MNAEKLFSIGGAIVTVAMVTVVVSHPQSAKVIRAVGDSFSGVLRSAMGR